MKVRKRRFRLSRLYLAYHITALMRLNHRKMYTSSTVYTGIMDDRWLADRNTTIWAPIDRIKKGQMERLKQASLRA